MLLAWLLGTEPEAEPEAEPGVCWAVGEAAGVARGLGVAEAPGDAVEGGGGYVKLPETGANPDDKLPAVGDCPGCGGWCC